MKRILCLLSFVLLPSFLKAAPIKVAMFYYPPFFMKQPNPVGEGFSADIIKAVGKRAKVELDLVYLPIPRAHADFLKKEEYGAIATAELIFNGMGVPKENFDITYIVPFKSVLYYNQAKNPGFAKIGIKDLLAKHSFAVQSPVKYSKLQELGIEAKTTNNPDINATLRMLVKGRIKLASSVDASMAYIKHNSEHKDLKNNKNLQALFVLEETFSCMIFKKKHAKEAQMYKKAMAEFKKTPAFKAILSKYLGENIPEGMLKEIKK